MASRPETIAKMKKAQALAKQGYDNDRIAEELGLKKSRVRELLKGVNWDSKAGEFKKIA